MQYTTTILQTGNNTGIPVSEEHLQQLGGGLKPLVKVTLNGHTYRGAVGKMGGRFLIALSAENRKLAGVTGGQEVAVQLELDTEPRTAEVPAELQRALDGSPAAKAAFEKLSPSRQKAIALSVAEAKSAETKAKRVEKALAELGK